VRPAGIGNSNEYPNSFNEKALFWSKSKEGENFVWSYIFEKEKIILGKLRSIQLMHFQ